MSELREKIARLIDANLDLGGETARHAYASADRILALPEIAEALETAANLRANQERQRKMLGHSIKVIPD